jgi:hypothetical protein
MVINTESRIHDIMLEDRVVAIEAESRVYPIE